MLMLSGARREGREAARRTRARGGGGCGSHGADRQQQQQRQQKRRLETLTRAVEAKMLRAVHLAADLMLHAPAHARAQSVGSVSSSSLSLLLAGARRHGKEDHAAAEEENCPGNRSMDSAHSVASGGPEEDEAQEEEDALAPLLLSMLPLLRALRGEVDRCQEEMDRRGRVFREMKGALRELLQEKEARMQEEAAVQRRQQEEAERRELQAEMDRNSLLLQQMSRVDAGTQVELVTEAQVAEMEAQLRSEQADKAQLVERMANMQVENQRLQRAVSHFQIAVLEQKKQLHILTAAHGAADQQGSSRSSSRRRRRQHHHSQDRGKDHDRDHGHDRHRDRESDDDERRRGRERERERDRRRRHRHRHRTDLLDDDEDDDDNDDGVVDDGGVEPYSVGGERARPGGILLARSDDEESELDAERFMLDDASEYDIDPENRDHPHRQEDRQQAARSHWTVVDEACPSEPDTQAYRPPLPPPPEPPSPQAVEPVSSGAEDFVAREPTTVDLALGMSPAPAPAPAPAPVVPAAPFADGSTSTAPSVAEELAEIAQLAELRHLHADVREHQQGASPAENEFEQDEGKEEDQDEGDEVEPMSGSVPRPVIGFVKGAAQTERELRELGFGDEDVRRIFQATQNCEDTRHYDSVEEDAVLPTSDTSMELLRADLSDELYQDHDEASVHGASDDEPSFAASDDGGNGNISGSDDGSSVSLDEDDDGALDDDRIRRRIDNS